ncbi:hypothetical protein IHE55_21340 [Streptomyces pactum]|uniref:TPM domain-containing protein n=1 Tax=Streptomyces pactum TaxID=68249 RepID=A0ABS0NQ02_9ACTN|nr:hypothetical protein [Streptomyces pactum]MBH5337172.1 hypothetical protein [Streptomyces pactum]
MRNRLFPLLAGVLLALAALLPWTAGGAAAADTGLDEAARALRQGPVYVDPGARDQLSRSEQNALAERIRDADRPVFVAVLPEDDRFPAANLLSDLRSRTGITGVYAVRLGDGFDAGADSSVMSNRAVDNLVRSVEPPGGRDAAGQLDDFVDGALQQARGDAPASWGGASRDATIVGALVTIGMLLVVAAIGAFLVSSRRRRRQEAQEQAALRKLRVVVDEDITAFGEELDRLDFHPGEPGADDAMRADYTRALDGYDGAKAAMAAARHPDDVRAVTRALDDGRHALAALAARRAGKPPPERRPPCFFDPRHGPSTTDARWAPPGGAERTVPVCAADAARLADGEEPAGRTVETARGRVPYWEAGPAYGPWAGGYFAAYGGGLLPGLLVGTMLGSMLTTPAYADTDGFGGDFSGGDVSGSDFDSGDFGGFDGGGGFGGGDGGFGGGDF